jgi:hypothetical protein
VPPQPETRENAAFIPYSQTGEIWVILPIIIKKVRHCRRSNRESLCAAIVVPPMACGIERIVEQGQTIQGIVDLAGSRYSWTAICREITRTDRDPINDRRVVLLRSRIVLMSDNGNTRLERLPATLATPLERAAGAVARLDSRLAGHPLAPAWGYRARLDAVRRQAAIDGQVIDPWHLAALIEGVRFRLDSPVMLDRGALFAAARHAFDLHQWFVRPDAGANGRRSRARLVPPN